MVDLEVELHNEIKKGPELSIIRLVDLLVANACVVNASDIHMDPALFGIVVRFRIDGILFRIGTLPPGCREELIARVKVITGLRTDVRLVPQDGRVRLQTEWVDAQVDVRVSIVPTQHGENIVMRLLPKERKAKNLLELGFESGQATTLETACARPSGFIMIAGPTGSGKTTTLYSMLHLIDRERLSVVTVEDPIEYSINEVRQIQTNAAVGFTFATALRSILRQDPDVIMIGEIRDEETMNICLGAALTGHLVITTFHSSDAATTITRLRAMGADPHVLSTTLTHVVNQRLVRKICVQCSAHGCAACHKSGYSGRSVISELLTINDEVRAAITDNKTSVELRAMVAEKGFLTLYEDGLQKIHKGITTDKELNRVCHKNS